MNGGIDGVVMESAWDGPWQCSCLQWYDDLRFRKRIADKRQARKLMITNAVVSAVAQARRRLATLVAMRFAWMPKGFPEQKCQQFLKVFRPHVEIVKD